MLELSKENDKLKDENEKLKEKLNDKTLYIVNCGSIAEAAMQLCGVFEAAQNAADCYLENIKLMHHRENSLSELDEDSTNIMTEDT